MFFRGMVLFWTWGLQILVLFLSMAFGQIDLTICSPIRVCWSDKDWPICIGLFGICLVLMNDRDLVPLVDRGLITMGFFHYSSQRSSLYDLQRFKKNSC